MMPVIRHGLRALAIVWLVGGAPLPAGEPVVSEAIVSAPPDAVWPAWATVGGSERRVLVQLFERRILTWTMTNDDPYKVEFGNIGQHFVLRTQPRRAIANRCGRLWRRPGEDAQRPLSPGRRRRPACI